MTREEAIKIIEYTFLNADGHLKPLDFDYGGGKGIVEALKMAIEALSQPSLPSNLDEAAEKYAIQGHESHTNTNYINTYIEGKRIGFIAGAEWREQQIPKLPDSLDEAAEKYSNIPYNFGEFAEIEYEFGEPIETIVDDKVFVRDAFKAGAEWAAGQSYTDEVKYSDLEDRKYVFVPYEEFNPGDKVVVQIRKK